jgi:hypothetical protein
MVIHFLFRSPEFARVSRNHSAKPRNLAEALGLQRRGNMRTSAASVDSPTVVGPAFRFIRAVNVDERPDIEAPRRANKILFYGHPALEKKYNLGNDFEHLSRCLQRRTRGTFDDPSPATYRNLDERKRPSINRCPSFRSNGRKIRRIWHYDSRHRLRLWSRAGVDEVFFVLPVAMFGIYYVFLERMRTILWLGAYKRAVEEKINELSGRTVLKWEYLIQEHRGRVDIIVLSTNLVYGLILIATAIVSIARIKNSVTYGTNTAYGTEILYGFSLLLLFLFAMLVGCLLFWKAAYQPAYKASQDAIEVGKEASSGSQ